MTISDRLFVCEGYRLCVDSESADSSCFREGERARKLFFFLMRQLDLLFVIAVYFGACVWFHKTCIETTTADDLISHVSAAQSLKSFRLVDDGKFFSDF